MLKARISGSDSTGHSLLQIDTEKLTPAYSHLSDTLTIALPDLAGRYTLQAELLNRPTGIRYPVTSKWDFRIFKAAVPHRTSEARIYVPEDEVELLAMLSANGLHRTGRLDKANVMLLSSISWRRLSSGDQRTSQIEATAAATGTAEDGSRRVALGKHWSWGQVA